MKRVVGGLGVVALSFLVASPAVAQQYPPTTTPTTAPAEVEVKGFGAVRPGQGFTKRDCGFAAGATVAVTLNGNGAGSATAGGDGCVEFDVEAVDRDTVTIDGRAFSVRCGAQVIEVSGTSATGAPRTVRNTFTVSCEEARGLPTTGASIVGWSAVGVGLVAVGAVFVVRDRRRSKATRDLA